MRASTDQSTGAGGDSQFRPVGSDIISDLGGRVWYNQGVSVEALRPASSLAIRELAGLSVFIT